MLDRNKIERQIVTKSEKAQSPSADKLSGERVPSQELAKDKNFSVGTKPFQNGEARSQPCVSRLSPLAVPVLRGSDPQPTQIPNAKADHMHGEVDRRGQIAGMHDADRTFFYSALTQLREDAKSTLQFLSHFDPGLSKEDAVILCCAINAIDRAEAPA